MISIGLPVFNGEARVRQAIDSILFQDFSNFEIVISDNASNDGTGSICESYARKDRRIRYYRNGTNIGVNPNHDRVFNLAKGEYFAWFADDVEYLPGMLTSCMRMMQEAPASVVMVYPRCEMVWDEPNKGIFGEQPVASRNPRAYRRLATVIRNVVMVNQFYGITRRDALAKTRLNGLYASSDYVLLAELAMLGQIWEIPEILIRRKIDFCRGTASVYHDEKAWRLWSGANKQNLKDVYLSNRERLALEYLSAAWHSPIRASEKLLCLMCVLPVYYARTSRVARLALKLARPWRWNWNLLKTVGRRVA